jgi:hypothetical protein
MQTSKFSLWICALALCGSLTLRADDTPAQAAARAALNQKLQEVESQPTSEAPATPAPAPTVEAPAATVTAPTVPEPMVGQPGDTEAQARARTALNEKIVDGGTPAPAAPASTLPTAAPSQKPIIAPALPINTSKAGKLDWLLSLYKTDQLTPEQYHKQRAEILAEP